MIERRILPSLLSAPFDRLGESIRSLEEAGCRLVHFDVMDGHFVPNLTVGPLVISALVPHCMSEFDVHLMVTDPERMYEWFLLDRVRSITVHGEATANLHALLKRIRASGKMAGVALNPATVPETLAYVLRQLDLVQVMTVNPGFGGQDFLPETLPKIRELARLRKREGMRFIIQVDGGINSNTIQTVLDAGADEVVIGHGIFNAPDPVAAYRRFQAELDRFSVKVTDLQL